ncbi:MAG: hypothetical protein Q4A58_06605 [Fusobacterium sp.]|uniref:tetratricopeptide repeat protein n=1 Tax=Fusobacterium sp. TaxID=68766 RepID=UPI0026DD3E07|nr:hypothetical protein [Fusobacterium sp.]MDO4690946.1 hypothetical protein [Fusobacterium sp.]
MKIFKKISIIFSIILLTSCTSLKTNSLKGITDILGLDNTEKEGSSVDNTKKQDEFIQENVILTDENVSEYLNIVKERLKKSEKRIVDSTENNYKVLVGEYLITPFNKGTVAKVINAPKNTNTRVKLEGTNLIFRTIYRGNYAVALYDGSSLVRKINISALTKFNFSEDNIYSIILANSEKKTKILENAISLYKIYYPNGVNVRKVNYFLLDYAHSKKDKAMIIEALESLKTEIENFNDNQKILILQAARLTNKDIFIPASLYRTKNTELEKELGAYLKSKNVLDKKDVVFLEKTSASENSEDRNTTLEKISSWYKNNGDVSKAKNLEDKTTNAKVESLYDIAIRNMNSNPKLAIDNFKKSLANEKNKNRRAETYYNIANSYLKLGNKVEALKYLTLIKQEFVGSDWVKKSELLINTIK